MDKAVFDELRQIVYDKSGIFLSENKTALVSSRINKRIRLIGLSSYKDYLNYLKKDESGEETINFLDVISTNTTSFFREPDHFDLLSELLGEWHRNGQTKFRIWSAACSSGEEPYTIAMTASDTLGNINVDLRILATDISTRILSYAQKGLYEEEKVKDIPPEMLKNYFNVYKDVEGALYEAGKKLKDMIIFRRLNLSDVPFPLKGSHDIIFCRNVMIYFDNKVREKLMKECYRLLKPGGYLLIGHSESLAGIKTDFQIVKPAVYFKPLPDNKTS